jgi:hypothetical protein
MSYCQDCKEKLYPEDPSVPQYNPRTHRYLRPLCEGCPDKEEPITREVEMAWTKKQWDYVLQLKGQELYNQKRITKLEDQIIKLSRISKDKI